MPNALENMFVAAEEDIEKSGARISKASRFVAIACEGEIEVHADGAGLGLGFATLCGLDGADEVIGQTPAPLPKKPKINCENCRAIIVEARRWTARDLCP